MKRSTLYLGLMLLAIPFLQGLQCDKYEGYADIEPEHRFKEKVSVLPYKLTYAVGDTVWLRVNIEGKRLFDEKTGTRVLFESALFNSMAQVQLLYDDPYIGDGPFARFIYPQGITAATNNFSYTSQAVIGFGCAPSSNYDLTLGVVLLKKGVFGIWFNTMSVQECGTNNYKNASLRFSFDVEDAHKQFYQNQPFKSIGKKADENVLTALDKKEMVVIQVL